MYQVTVPTKHIEKMKALGCYDAWFTNVKSNMTEKTRTTRSYSNKSWYTLIIGSFSWAKSPEGCEYWSKIAHANTQDKT